MKTRISIIILAALLAGTTAHAATKEGDNKKLVLRMLELVNEHKLDQLGDVIAANFMDHGPSQGGGLKGFQKGVAFMHSAFPDLRFGVEDIIAEGDKVTIRGTLSGTFSGTPLFGVKATGKKASWLTLMTFRIADGKLAERWTDADTWGMLGRIGVRDDHPWDSSQLEVDGARDASAETSNKQSARALVEAVWIKRNMDAVDTHFAKGAGLAVGTPGSGKLLTPNLIKMIGGWVFNAFPDFEAKIDFVIAEGNKVVVRISESGTHTAQYAGIPASNKKVRWSDSFLFVFDAKGKITQAWLQSNQMGLMSQIGGFKPVKSAEAQIGAAEKNKAIFLRFINEFWNERKFEIADELVDPEHFSSSIPNLPKGPQGMKIIAGVVAGQIFPDLKRKVIHVFASDDMVGGIWENSGTHKGTYMNIPATGKKVSWLELGIIKMKDGKMVESWYRPDEVGLCKELAPEKLEWLHF